jgi:hypothetical protein
MTQIINQIEHSARVDNCWRSLAKDISGRRTLTGRLAIEANNLSDEDKAIVKRLMEELNAENR